MPFVCKQSSSHCLSIHEIRDLWKKKLGINWSCLETIFSWKGAAQARSSHNGAVWDSRAWSAFPALRSFASPAGCAAGCALRLRCWPVHLTQASTFSCWICLGLSLTLEWCMFSLKLHGHFDVKNTFFQFNLKV